MYAQSELELLEALEALEETPQHWLQVLFPDYVKYPFAQHHLEFWRWVWKLRANKPLYHFINIWPRGHGKSTSAELATVAVGARGVRRYVLYISETQEQADKHVLTIGSLLENSLLAEFYPQLCERQLNKYGHSKGWRANRLTTASGLVVDALGLDSAARGIKFEEARPDLMVLDDIDGRHDSPQTVRTKIETLTSSILPAGAEHNAVVGIQNLIHKDSIFSRLLDGRANFLVDRQISGGGAVPALRGYRVEKRADRLGYQIVAGQPTWAGYDLAKCQRLLDTIGLEAFARECQHDTSVRTENMIFPEYDEVYHVITRAEFERVVGALPKGHLVPPKWQLGRAQDWGTTTGHPCATVWVARPDEASGLQDCVFVYRELIKPEWPHSTAFPDPVSPRRVAAMIRQLEAPANETSRMHMSIFSHEQTAVLNAYLYDLPENERLYFSKWERRMGDGIAVIQNCLEIDQGRPHPFRCYPEGHPEAGRPIRGRPRLYLIVANGQGELYIDSEQNLLVRQPENAAGLARLRWEIPLYKKKVDSQGIELDRADDKKDDDAVDALRYLAAYFFPRNTGISEVEKQELALPEAVREATLQHLFSSGECEEAAGRWIGRQMVKFKHQAIQPNRFGWVGMRNRRRRFYGNL